MPGPTGVGTLGSESPRPADGDIMPYVSLEVPAGTPPILQAFLLSSVDKYLFEIRWMLATNMPTNEPGQHWHYSTAVMLLCSIAAISVTLYPADPKLETGDRFKGLLRDHF